MLVHRDRDSLTDAEVLELKNSYAGEGVQLWLTDQSDLEAEFCDPTFLSALTGQPIHVCETWVSEILSQNQVPIKEQFVSQRASHNEELHKAGGSPTNDDVWAALQGRPLKGAKGKFIFKQMKNKVPANAFSEANVESLGHYPERAVSLRANLEDLLA